MFSRRRRRSVESRRHPFSAKPLYRRPQVMRCPPRRLSEPKMGGPATISYSLTSGRCTMKRPSWPATEISYHKMRGPLSLKKNVGWTRLRRISLRQPRPRLLRLQLRNPAGYLLKATGSTRWARIAKTQLRPEIGHHRRRHYNRCVQAGPLLRAPRGISKQLRPV